MIEAIVRGYHVYKEIWCAAVGEELSCMREVENYRDPFAVAVSITRFNSALADSMDDDVQKATWIRKLGSIARRFKIA